MEKELDVEKAQNVWPHSVRKYVIKLEFAVS